MGEHVAADVSELPSELAYRIAAATAHARCRRIERRGAGYAVYALSGDRIVVMELALRSDGSVSERTDSVVLGTVRDVISRHGATFLGVTEYESERLIEVPAEFAATLRSSLS
ncbi:MAG TPA: hypothetical protein VK975_05100 [Acidimicrobiales bacterium]|nr:hypothetical protein [Acidimicrobiales bacterium]